MDKSELLTRLKYRRMAAISEMLKNEENEESMAKLSAIQGAIAAVEAYAAESPDTAESPWNDPSFTINN
ncbi:hypothetical protein CN186_08685 [Sinorhizobium medicae]|uniref:hypothetical protein n=1 Tax=Sinorhizobium medicae TaxID=110321 RepID=UPI000FDB004F|nr:hypothetical protein [Sinorhizobium medicae]RVI95667.1 hypothetical protein CN186_08685 [Sinorhizobium medicae]